MYLPTIWERKSTFCTANPLFKEIHSTFLDNCSKKFSFQATLKKDTVCSKSVQTDRRAFTETTRNGFYNGLFGNVCCEEVII